MYNLNYVPTTLGGTKSKRNYMWGSGTKMVEYRCVRGSVSFGVPSDGHVPQGCSNPGRPVAQVTKFYSMANNILSIIVVVFL
jgi:hypothetical protein